MDLNDMDWLPDEVCNDFANVSILNNTNTSLTSSPTSAGGQDLYSSQLKGGSPVTQIPVSDHCNSMPADSCGATGGRVPNMQHDYKAAYNMYPPTGIDEKGYSQYAMDEEKVPSPDMQADSTGSMAYKKRDQKRRPKPKDGTVLFCQICGDKALGYNFDAITCESCKAFFRRNALKTKVFTCSFEGNCKLDPHTRKFCSGCRLKKCVDVGMKKEWILSDTQLAKRRKKCHGRSPENVQNYSPTSQVPLHMTSSPESYIQTKHEPYQSPEPYRSPVVHDTEVSTTYLSDSTDNSISSMSTPSFTYSPPVEVKMEPAEDDQPRPLPPEIAEAIASLEKDYYSVFDSGYVEHQAKKIMEKPHNANDLFNMTDIFIRRLIKFAKHIPEFKQLKQEDQIFLLKGGIMEIMVLRSAMGFDPNNQEWRLKQLQDLKEHGINPEIIKEQLGTGMYKEHMQFVTSLHQLTNSNKVVMMLLFVIEIFSPDRQSVKSKEVIQKAQEKFTGWLQVYLESIMPVWEAKNLYPKLLVKLLDVRDLGESSAKLASNLDITKLEPLLIEVFSLQK